MDNKTDYQLALMRIFCLAVVKVLVLLSKDGDLGTKLLQSF